MILLVEGMEKLREEVNGDGKLQVKAMRGAGAAAAGVIRSARDLKVGVG